MKEKKSRSIKFNSNVIESKNNIITNTQLKTNPKKSKFIKDNKTEPNNNKLNENSNEISKLRPSKSMKEIKTIEQSLLISIEKAESIDNAKMNTKLTRIEMAKMLSYYAINVLWKKPNVSKNIKFDDVSLKLNAQYNNAVVLSYQLGIMWQNVKNNKFRPNDLVTRAEFGTALSRLIYWISDWTTNYYSTHLEKLFNEWIISKYRSYNKERR